MDEKGIWRSVVAISISVAVPTLILGATVGAIFAGLMIAIGLDWATRRRRRFVQRLRRDP
jgi:hypothetical protein